MNIPAIVGFGLIHILIILGVGTSNISSFIDIPSLQIVFGVTVASSFVSSPFYVVSLMPSILNYALIPSSKSDFAPKSIEEIKPFIDMFESMSRVAVGAGIVGSIIGLILMLGNMSDVESIGPNMAVSLITLLYGTYLSELVLQPIKRMIISRFESDVNIEKKYTELAGKRFQENQKSTRTELILFAIFLPVLAFFVLLLSMTDLPWNEKEPTIWEKNNISHLSLIPHKLNGKKVTLFDTKLTSTDLLKGHIVRAFHNDIDSLYLGIDTLYFNVINSNEVLLEFPLTQFNDSIYDFRYDSSLDIFQYPISLKEERTILYENDSLSVEFRVIPVFDTIQES